MKYESPPMEAPSKELELLGRDGVLPWGWGHRKVGGVTVVLVDLYVSLFLLYFSL